MPRARAATAGVILSAVAAVGLFAQPLPPADVFFSRLPHWLPPPAIPADNPITQEKIALGRSLFYDKRLSGNGTYSCGSCHQQALAFTDGLAHAVGSTGQHHSRSSMTLTNVAYNATYGWDDHRSSLEAQMEVPMYNQQPIEMGLKGREEQVLRRFSSSGEDVDRFRAAFPGDEAPVTLDNIIKAIASFERTLISGGSPYDRYRFLDDRGALSPSAQRGMALFSSDRLRCSECHSGVNLSGPITSLVEARLKPDPTSLASEVAPTADLLFHDTGVAMRPAKFRAPTLRNVAVTAPYMHDGSLATLRDVIAHYARGGRPREGKSERIAGFRISASEVDDLVAFLESLTDQTFLTDPALSDPH